MHPNQIIYKKIVALGVGITNKCQLNCPHCYSRPLAQLDMKPKDFWVLIKKYPNLKKINFGTGESILNPDFLKIMTICRQRRIAMALTTNGLTVKNLSDQHLRWFKDIDFSLDFPSAQQHDQWRGAPGLFAATLTGLQRCQKLGIKTSIVCCLMNNNYQYLAGFRQLLDQYHIYLRLNLYKSAWTKKFNLKYKEFWSAIKILAKNFVLVSNSEPILSVITDESSQGSPCGECSARIHPDKSITPCVYLQGQKISFKKFIKLKKFLPRVCGQCTLVTACRGGCLSRRILDQRINRPDAYCPLARHQPWPKITFKKELDKEFVHADYLCTLIVK